MFNENFLYCLIYVAVAMLVCSMVFGGLLYFLVKFIRISPFKDTQKKIAKCINILENIDKVDKVLENLKYADSVSAGIYDRLNKIQKSLEKNEKIIFEDDGKCEERYIESCKEELENPIEFEPEFESLIDYSENLFEENASNDDIPYENEIDRDLPEFDFSDKEEETPKYENKVDSFIVEDDEACPFIESTITSSNIPKLDVEDYRQLSADERLVYAESALREKYPAVKDVPEKAKEALLNSRLEQYCCNKDFVNTNKVIVNKDHDTGRFKLDIQNNIEKMYMDKCRNEGRQYLI